MVVLAQHAASAPSSWPRGAHIHRGWELKLALRGRLEQWTTQGLCKLRAPGVILIPPGVVHGASDPEALSDQQALLCWTDDPGGGKLWMGSGKPSGGGHHELELRSALLRDHLGGAPAEAAERIAGAIADGGGYARLRAEAMLVILLGALADSCAPASPARLGLVERAVAIMRQSYFDPDLGVAAISARLGCTPRRLRQLFSFSGRRGVRQELIAVRLQHARRMLRAGGRSVKEVARLTGWRSPFHFSRSFQRCYGVPPSRC